MNRRFRTPEAWTSALATTMPGAAGERQWTPPRARTRSPTCPTHTSVLTGTQHPAHTAWDRTRVSPTISCTGLRLVSRLRLIFRCAAPSAMGGVTCCAGLPPLFIKTYRSGVARMILAFIIKADFPFRSESILKTVLFMSPFASCKNPEEWPLLCTVNWSVFICRTQICSIYTSEFQRNICLNFLKLNTAHHCMFGPVIFVALRSGLVTSYVGQL